MKFASAHLSHLDPDTDRMLALRSFAVPPGSPDSGLAGSITLVTRDGARLGKRAEVRHYSATQVERDGEPRLLDWYVLWSPEITFLDSRIYVVGFMLGLQGRRQDGLCVKHADPYCVEDETGEHFERVEFALS